jgi:hypothetical protein
VTKKPETGVSRRTMLGALVAAPVAVPAMAKEAVASSGLAHGGYFAPMSEMLVGEATLSGGHRLTGHGEEWYGSILRADKIHATTITSGCGPIDGPISVPCVSIGERDSGWSVSTLTANLGSVAVAGNPTTTPNRLFGAYINQDGDAV